MFKHQEVYQEILNVFVLILFPGISEDDFNDLLKESMAGKFDRKELWQQYHSLNNIHDSFRIHIYAGKVIIVKG